VKILVAEDEPVARRLVEAAIQKLGHEPYGAVDGLEAWDLFQTREFDVIISDWRMPRSDGTDLCRKVRSCADDRSYTPFIFLTALDDKRHALQAMTAGADDYLVKPLDIDDLHARLIAAERLKRVEDERRRLLDVERVARLDTERALALRDQVLWTVSHDLRAPLAGIFGRVRLLRFRIQGAGLEEPGTITDELQKIEGTAKRMEGWLDELADAASLEIGNPLDLQTEATDLGALVREVASDVRGSSSHSLEVEAGPEPLVGNWDRRRVERVVSNLIGNATKYSTANTRVQLAVSREDEWAVLRVIDHGIGIPAADLAQVFNRFFRGSNVESHRKGSGIGLSGVRRIVEQHGGSIALSSTVGVGTVCTVRLPLPVAERANTSVPVAAGALN
jgi:signal transduction histidine kinase